MPGRFFDYQSRIRPIWCTYCGDYGVLTSLIYAFVRLDLDPSTIAIVSGIGCSGRLSAYTKARGFHSLHGRALPIAQGVKVARPEWTVLAVGGDGDILGIGGGHLIHAARRNLPVTTILIDNEVYAMTKGQASPTTPPGETTRSTPFGNIERPLDPILLAISSGATFVARGFSGRAEELVDVLAGALAHKGFSFVHVFSPCVTFNPKTSYKFFSEKVTPVPADHNRGDRLASMKLCMEDDRLYLGIFYKEEIPTFLDGLPKVPLKEREEFLKELL